MSYRCIVAMSALVMVGGRGAEQEEVADVGDGAPFPDLVETTETEPVGETSDALGVTCSSPADCVEKCVAEKKYCWAEKAEHPKKPPLLGDLFDCLDSFPKAKYGGSYTCLYRYPNEDVCVFSYASKLGPLHFPAPPPLCVYKGGKP
jgi:hypothetical protein